MLFEQPKPSEEIREKQKDKSLDKETEKLLSFLELMAEELRKEGVPVNNECRVDMSAFRGVYRPEEVEEDKQEVAKIKERIRIEESKKIGRRLSEEEFEKKTRSRKGNQLEMLKTAIFYKNLGSDFIVARSSQYDDIKRGVDNLILEKKTGNLVCAFDEVASRGTLGASEKGRRIHEEKRKKILEQNIKWGGGRLKYGLKMEGKGGEMKLKLGEAKNIPIFYLASLPATIEQGIKNLKSLLDEQSDFERLLFHSFVKSLRSQINSIAPKFNKSLSPEFKKSLLLFEESLERFSQNK